MQKTFNRFGFWAVAFLLALAPVAATAAEPPPPPFGPPPGFPKGVAPQVAPSLQPSTELVYKPIVPCRAFGGQPITANQTKGFLVSGNSNFTAQGGPAGGCGVPAYAKAVSINLSSGTSTAQGYLTAYATGDSRPNQASLSYRAYPATTGSIVKLGTGGRISVFASAATRVTGDVAGYYVEQIHGLINSTGTSFYSGSSGLVSTTLYATGVFKVIVDRDVTYCTPVANPYYGTNLYATAYAFDGNLVTVYIWELDLANNQVKPKNAYVYLAIHC